MFKGITQRIQDMKALSSLMQSAEHHSRQRNQGDKPSAEHFVLAAIDSQDGAARKVFQKLGLQASDFEDALRDQYKNSLSSMGIDVDILCTTVEPANVLTLSEQFRLNTNSRPTNGIS